MLFKVLESPEMFTFTRVPSKNIINVVLDTKTVDTIVTENY